MNTEVDVHAGEGQIDAGRNLALELVRVTEAAALGAARLVGKGDKEAADQAAVDGMRWALPDVDMDGIVVIGEGEKDEAPMLYNGEQVGNGAGPSVDIAVDPLEGTTLAARGVPNALAVIALSPRGTMLDPGPCFFMHKIVGGAEIADLLDLDRPFGETLRLIAGRRRIDVGDVTVVMLDRPRHDESVAAVRSVGARVRFISDGDVAGALLAVTDDVPGRPAVGFRRDAGGRALGGRDQVSRRADARAASGFATTPSGKRRLMRATTSRRSSPTRI